MHLVHILRVNSIDIFLIIAAYNNFPSDLWNKLDMVQMCKTIIYNRTDQIEILRRNRNSAIWYVMYKNGAFENSQILTLHFQSVRISKLIYFTEILTDWFCLHMASMVCIDCPFLTQRVVRMFPSSSGVSFDSNWGQWKVTPEHSRSVPFFRRMAHIFLGGRWASKNIYIFINSVFFFLLFNFLFRNIM